jgi:N-acetylmuramoyl-L-alanine amidase
LKQVFIIKFFTAIFFSCCLSGQLLAEPNKIPVVIIDPGHGGEDLGAEGLHGMVEKDLVLDIANELAKYLRQNLSAVVRFTRDEDVFIPLADRTAFANDYEADVFISLHANASQKKKLSGFEVYYLDNTNDHASKKLAERENRSVLQQVNGDLGFIISDLIQNNKLADSIKLAKDISKSIDHLIIKSWKGSRNLGVKKGPFYVLVGAHMPCVLVELFFIDNKSDGERLANPQFRKDLAYALYIGIEDFLNNRQTNKS